MLKYLYNNPVSLKSINCEKSNVFHPHSITTVNFGDRKYLSKYSNCCKEEHLHFIVIFLVNPFPPSSSESTDINVGGGRFCNGEDSVSISCGDPLASYPIICFFVSSEYILDVDSMLDNKNPSRGIVVLFFDASMLKPVPLEKTLAHATFGPLYSSRLFEYANPYSDIRVFNSSNTNDSTGCNPHGIIWYSCGSFESSIVYSVKFC